MNEAGSSKQEDKVTFGSHAWLNSARQILEDLVEAHGEQGTEFSVCEVFTDAPVGLAGPEETICSWHFRITGKAVDVGEGEIEDADVSVRVDYQETLPKARLVYTPEMIEEARKNSPISEQDRSKMPPWLIELHNRLAVITA